MGVRGLMRVLETAVPEGMKHVNIEEEIRKYQRIQGETPLLIVDLQALAYVWSSVDNASVGMRGNVLVQKASNFFHKLKKSGASLVFFDGGNIQKSKENLFFEHRQESKTQKLVIIQELESGMPIRSVIKKNKNSLRGTSTIVPLIKEVAREYGTVYAPIHTEKHTIMAAFANNNKAFAVLGNDSNFLIYCGRWRYWAIDDKFNGVTMKEYNSDALKGFLNLTVEQMPLFATLAGNQIIDFEDFRGFHGRVGAKLRFQKVATYVKRQRFPLGTGDIERIAKTVFRNKMNPQSYATKIKKSIDSYQWKSAVIRDNESDPFMKRLLDEDWTIHYEILKNLPAIILSSYIDLREQDFEKSFGDLATTLVRRHMGILWQHKKQPGLKRDMYVSAGANQEIRCTKMDAEYPEFEVPPLEKLIFREENDGLDLDRHRLLQFVVGNGLDTDKLFKLDPVFIPTIALLYYFVKEAGLQVEEANIFLLSTFEIIQEEQPKTLQLPKTLNVRAFKIVFLFIKFQRMFLPIFATLGYKNLAKHIPFDGLYFHILWQEWEKLSEKEKEPRLDKIKHMQLYDN